MVIRFEGVNMTPSPQETVLDCLERHGVSVPSFCRAGVCQSCLVKATSGAVPRRAQAGLKDAWREQGLFLSCVCAPEGDLEVERCEVAASHEVRIERVERLPENVLRVQLSVPPGFRHRAGQFIQLERPEDGLMRPYSIASLPGAGHLELHVALLAQGAMSGWLQAAEGQMANVRGPYGDCFYIEQEPERPLVLAGTGTGLAPLLGVARAALAAGHRAPIRLYHGSLRRSGLYLWGELQALLEQAPQLTVIGSVLEGSSSDVDGEVLGPRSELRSQPIEKAVLGDTPSFAEHRVYLCGHPDMVRLLQRKVYLANGALNRIHADPFLAPAARP